MNKETKPASDIKEQLRQERELSGKIADNSTNVIFAFDRGMCISLWNPQAERLTGLSKQQTLGKCVGEIPRMLSFTGSEEVYGRVLAGESIQLAERPFFVEAFGVEAVLEVFLTPLRDGAGNVDGGLAIVHDITRHKRAEEELKAGEALLREAQRLAHLGSWSWDIRSDEIRWSDEMFRIAGREPQPLTTEIVLGWLNPQDQERWRATLKRSIANGQGVIDEARVVRPDGDERIVEARVEIVRGPDNHVVKLRGTWLDITERKRTEMALRDAEARARQQAEQLELIYRTAPVGLCVLDTALRYVHINQRLAEMNGNPPEAHLGKTLSEMVPEIAKQAEPFLRHVLATGEPAQGVESSAHVPPGVQRHWISQFWPLKSSEGAVLGINVVVEDVTEHKWLDESLAREREFRTLAENSTDIIVRFDRALRPVYVNRAIEAVLGRPRAEILTEQGDTVFSEGLFKRMRRELKEVFATGRPRTLEATLPTPNGERYLDARLVPEFGSDGKVETVLVVDRDITDIKHAQQALEQLTLVDPLTGIANRRYLDQVVEREWRREARHKHHVSLIMVDIDHFKAFNDHYGHQQGDECLRQVAQTLQQTLHRPADTPARYGGEEFAVFLPETSKDAARELAERLRQAVADLQLPHAASPVADRVTISLGVAGARADEGEFRDLLAAADVALYRAKHQGRNRVETGP